MIKLYSCYQLLSCTLWLTPMSIKYYWLYKPSQPVGKSCGILVCVFIALSGITNFSTCLFDHPSPNFSSLCTNVPCFVGVPEFILKNQSFSFSVLQCVYLLKWLLLAQWFSWSGPETLILALYGNLIDT